jgi:hypothetical protein
MCPECPAKHGTLQDILNECFKNKDRVTMDRRNLLATEVETALLKYTNYSKAIHGGKIIKDHYLNLRDVPEDCRMLRPDLVVQNPLAKKLYVFEFACTFAKIHQNGDALRHAYEYEEGKYGRLCNRAKTQLPGWDVQQITVIVPSLGATYKDTLKRLTSVMELSPARTGRIGQRLSDAAINGSHAIWKQYQQEIAKMSPVIEFSGTTPDVESTPADFSDFEQSPKDTEEPDSSSRLY